MRAHSVVTLAAILLLAACAKQKTPEPQAWSFGTPEQAVSALITALERGDINEVEQLLGPGTKGMLSSGDEVADRKAREAFLQRYREKHQLVAGSADRLALQVGNDAWPMPIPIVRHDGRWSFDGVAGAEELVLRRIGRNELHTIAVMHGFVDAQEEYASASHDGAPAGIYAQRARSEPGKHDGLYWEAAPGEPPSPLGPLFAEASHEGYSKGSGAAKPYHGYRYRMLFAQGDAATGGARNYLAEGQLKNGFALIAYPATYGTSGVMTFIVNQDGVIWQRDLGEETPKLAGDLQQFNPDANWVPLAQEG